MAGYKKRKMDFEHDGDRDDDQMIGYVSSVSPLKTSRDGKTTYFHATFQSSKEDHKNMVIFTPEKHGHFHHLAETDDPVKLRQTKVTPSKITGELEIICGKSTDASVCTKRLSFAKCERLVEKKTTNAVTISQLDNNYQDKMVDIHAKFLTFIDEKPREVNTRYGVRLIQNGIVADTTGNIKICCWGEKMSSQFKEDASYQITNLMVKQYDNKLVLNTSSLTELKPAAPVVSAQDNTEHLMQTITEVAELCTVQLKRELQCVSSACRSAIVVDPATKDITAKCPKCAKKMRIDCLICTVKGTMSFKTINSLHTKDFTISHNVLQDFTKANKLQNMMVNPDRLEDILLNMQIFKIKYDHGSSFLKNLEPHVSNEIEPRNYVNIKPTEAVSVSD